MEKIEDKLAQMAPEELSKNAQHIWQMLDDMAETNPSMYRKFIDKQMSDSKKANAKPNPHMCVQTKITSPQQTGLFINIFDWTRVPEPKSDEDPIPVMGGPIYDGKDDTGVYKIVTVAFSPKVTQEFGIDSQLYQERNMLINLAIDYLQDQHKLIISRSFILLRKPKRYKGTLIKAIETVTQKTRQQDQALDKEIGELQNMFGSLTNNDKDSLMGQLGSITVSEKEESKYVLDDPNPISDDEAVEGEKAEDRSLLGDLHRKTSAKDKLNILGSSNIGAALKPDIRLPGDMKPTQNGTKTSLIQEVGVESGRTLIEPEYSITTKSEMGGRKTVVKIELPGVKSVAECELDIAKSDLHLLVENQFELNLPFEQPINEQDATAKFSKKSSTLTLTLPFI